MLAFLLSAVLAFYTPAESNNLTRTDNGNPYDEPYTVITTEAGRECVFVPEGKFLYFRVNSSVLTPAMNTLLVRLTYLDRGTDQVQFQYNATGDRNYQTANISRTNTGEWLTTTIALTDASFRNAQNHGDFRINAGNYIARVEISDGTLDPLAEPVPTHPGASSYSEMRTKSVAGYQGWFRVGGQKDFWHHWGNDAVESDGTRWPRKYNHTFEIYPDVSLYEDADLAQTGFADLGNGNPAKLYNALSSHVIASHFDLMQQSALDGVAVQRFIGHEMKTVTYNPAHQLAVIRQNAERTERIFYICYDITSNGLEDCWADLIRFDWVYTIEQNLALIQSPAYATMDGKPVVQIWGTGFTGNHPGTARETTELIEWFKSRGCYVIGGVPTYWRENRNDAKGPSQPDPDDRESFEQVYLHYDMLSPWLVGRFSNTAEAQYFYQQQALDKAYCGQHRIDYMPVLFAGFGWATWNTGNLNQAPRLAGAFLWDQASHICQNGCKNMYFAMFDEYDEGTALLNAATDWTMIPQGNYFLTTSADGMWLSSDYYLRLAGDAIRMLRSGKPAALSTPHSLGPVYYRNGFESVTTPYDYQNGTARRTGTFPVDPCLHEAALLSQTNAGQITCTMEKGNTYSGDYALKFRAEAAAANASALYRIAATSVAVTEPLRLTAYVQGDVQLQLVFASGKTLATATDSVGNWSRVSAVVPAAMTGDSVTGIALIATSADRGAYTAYVDDILLQTCTGDCNNISSAVLHTEETAGLQTTKLLRNAQLVIKRGDTMYDLLGRVVQ